jgi:hypothetical protein
VATLALLVAALTPALVPLPAAQAGEEPLLTTDGTICYERIAESKDGWHVTVELSDVSKQDVIFAISTHDGTAVAPDDYIAFRELVVRIPAGERSVDVPLEIVADKEREEDEWFLVTLDWAQGAIIGTEKAEIIIKDGSPPKGAW